MRHLLRRADDRHAEAVAAVDRHDRQPGAFRPDEDEAIALALVVQRVEVRAAEDHVGGVGERRMPAHRNAERLAHERRAAVGADHVVGGDLARLAGHRVAHGGGDMRALILEADQLGVVLERDARKLGRPLLDDGIEHVLRHALALLRALLRQRLEAAAGEFLAAELVAGERLEPDIVLRIVGRIRRVAHAVGDAPAAAELHGAHADEVHLRMVDAAFGLLDQRAGDAAPAEIAGQREPDRAGADDEDGGVGGGWHGARLVPSD